MVKVRLVTVAFEDGVVESGTRPSTLELGCQVWNLVVKSGTWLSSLELGNQAWNLVVESGTWLWSLEIGR